MRRILSIFVAAILIINVSTSCLAQDKWENLLLESARVFEEMAQMPEDGIPQDLLKDCKAIAIFPSVVGGGFVIGGKYGQGVIVARNQRTSRWGSPAVFNLAGASLGWQIGGQASDIILLIMNERGLDGLLQSKFKLGGDVSIAAGPVGREAEASTDLQLKGGILSYSRSRGAFIGIKLEGAMISFNEEANSSLYGEGISAEGILTTGRGKTPEYAKRLLKDLRKY